MEEDHRGLDKRWTKQENMEVWRTQSEKTCTVLVPVLVPLTFTYILFQRLFQQ